MESSKWKYRKSELLQAKQTPRERETYICDFRRCGLVCLSPYLQITIYLLLTCESIYSFGISRKSEVP